MAARHASEIRVVAIRPNPALSWVPSTRRVYLRRPRQQAVTGPATSSDAPRLRPVSDRTDSEAAEARYEPADIEARWQKVWEDEATWQVPNPGDPGYDGSKPKAYVLEMLPYPSGEPHVGHLKCYSVGDAIAHFRRRHGF